LRKPRVSQRDREWTANFLNLIDVVFENLDVEVGDVVSVVDLAEQAANKIENAIDRRLQRRPAKVVSLLSRKKD
jgi:hypothetical protein